ncbi:MAG TPA: CHRD domain-containing protein [Mycobacteriales bacterium]|nr:CHRD domain-containing protein [Mycobacteriales bacterium]
MRRTVATSLALTVAATAAVATTTVLAGSASAAHEGRLLTAALDGRSEVATGAQDRRIVGDPDGRGEAYVFGTEAAAGDPAGTGRVCYVLEADKIAPATAAHIHRGAAGENGPVVAALSAPSDGTSAGCVVLPVADVRAIFGNPAGFYVNVHNAEFPGGALRGQLAEQ